MKFGVALESFTPPGKRPDISLIAQTATLADSLGFDSVWVWDHLLLGSKRVFSVLESITLLSSLALITKRVKFGVSTLILPLRDPVVLAKELQTLSFLSNNRLILAVAVGWYHKEYEITGKPYSERGAIIEEYLEILRMLLSKSDINSTVRTRKFVHVTMEPRVEGNLKILMGGYTVLKRIAQKSDGWISFCYTPNDFEEAWDMIRRIAKESGRLENDLTNVNIVPICVDNDSEKADRMIKQFVPQYMDFPTWSKSNIESSIKGSVDECVRQIERYESSGVKCLEFLPCAYDIGQVEIIGKEILPRFIK
ncbi:MAG: LLM class flavin-dependent oxidoreductase [Nitrososphaerales archaeon]